MSEKFRILSLDGGGVRGYLTVMILENIEKQLNARDGSGKPLGEYFDLIVGTSTGAIIGGLLSIGKKASEVREIYENDIQEIFSNDMRKCKILNFFPFNIIHTKYKKDNLRDKAIQYFQDNNGKDLTFLDVKTHLLVTSVDITTMTPRFHKSAYNKKNIPRADEKLSSAIIASSSAPAFFPIEENLIYSSNLIDGGIVANNPSLVALVDCFSFDEAPNKDDIVLLSIGTGKACEVPYEIDALKDTSVKWLRQNGTSPLIEILMNSQSVLAEFQTSFLMEQLNCKMQYKRINPNLGVKIELDEANKIDILKNLADLDQDNTQWVLKYL